MENSPNISQAAVNVIYGGAQFNIQKNYLGRPIVSDSSATIKTLQFLQDQFKIGLKKDLNKLKNLGQNNKVALQWVQRHVVVEDNETADDLARVGTPLIGTEPCCGLGD